MNDLIPDEKRFERVREYLAKRREVTPMIDGEQFDTIHDIDLGSAGHVKLFASDLEVLVRPVSPVTFNARTGSYTIHVPKDALTGTFLSPSPTATNDALPERPEALSSPNGDTKRLGYYTDRRNGDLWHLSESGWSWVNGTGWYHVPKEHLVWTGEPNPFRRPSPVTREAVARFLADLGPDEAWPTNAELGGGPTGTRDDEYRSGMFERADDFLSRFSLPEPTEDEWCREESCQYRHWRSGSMPTHKRGAGCPPPVPVKGAEQ